MTMNIKTLGIVANENGTLENLEKNIESIETGVARFVNSSEEVLVNK